jgi:hypothetical protein
MTEYIHDRQPTRCRNCGGIHPDDCLDPYCDNCMPGYQAFLDAQWDWERRMAASGGRHD